MHPYLRFAAATREQTIDRIRELVKCESPSREPAAVNLCVDALTAQTAGLAKARRIRARGYGDHLALTFHLPGSARRRMRPAPLLLLGHSDTVWPLGTLASMPFRRARSRLFGPGVLDMKAGLVFACQAVRLLRELDIPVARRVMLLVVSDEEIGSPSSRSLTEATAADCDGVLVLEPGTGLEGKLKTARKGVGRYLLRVAGRASHAGVDFAQGASAILELARQTMEVSKLTDLARGITVNPGVVRGGSASNVVAAAAELDIDVRVARPADELRVQKKLLSLEAFDPGCTLHVTGGPNRPPMPRSPVIARLFQRAAKLAAEIPLPLEESSTGGGSDGNFTAALGVPTLDGLGAVGEGAHAENESVLISRIPQRIALLAVLIAGL